MFNRLETPDEDEVDALPRRDLPQSANSTIPPPQEFTAPPNKTSKTGDTAKPKVTKEKAVRWALFHEALTLA